MPLPKRDLSREECLSALRKCKRTYPGIEDSVYYFIGEWGRVNLTYAQYLFNRKMRKLYNSKDRYVLFCGRRLYSYSLDYLQKNRRVRDVMSFLEKDIKLSPIKYFMPNGTTALNFLNDRENSLKMLVAGNRFGKTTHGIVDMVLDLIPCDPKWKIFTENGVNFRPWNGEPKAWGVASYMWRHITMTINPLIMQWMPEEFLGDYALHQKGGAKKVVNAEKRPFVELTNGSNIQYFCYQQDTANFESVALDGWLWDEQGMMDKFDGADERTRTKKNGRHIFPMTPHKIEGRSDTGAGTWMHKLWLGEQNKGHRIGRYQANTFDNPDWIYSEKNKRMAYNKWVTEPSMNHDRKTLAEGEARLYGNFHEGSGLVYDELVRGVHVIDPFEIPAHWTRYRAMDHGLQAPTVCLCAAVSPNNDVIIYDMYYKGGRTIYQNCEKIIEMCGNQRIHVGKRQDADHNIEFDEYAEIQSGTKFAWTKLDSRSKASKNADSNFEIGELYGMAGIECEKASGSRQRIEVLKEALLIDYDATHLVSGKKGAPKVYFFSTCKMLISEMFAYVWMDQKESTAGISDPKPRKKNDHSVNALEYLIMGNPCYEGEYMQSDMDQFYDGVRVEEYYKHSYDRPNERPVNSITGY